MSDHLAVILSPNSFDGRPKSFTVGLRQWQLAVRMVDRAGFRCNVVGGLDKRDVPTFASYLQQALDKERVSDHDRQELTKLVAYLKGDGANVRGLGLSRGFKRWNQA